MFLREKLKKNVTFSFYFFDYRIFYMQRKKIVSEMKNAKPLWFKKYSPCKPAFENRFGFKTCKELA